MRLAIGRQMIASPAPENASNYKRFLYRIKGGLLRLYLESPLYFVGLMQEVLFFFT